MFLSICLFFVLDGVCILFTIWIKFIRIVEGKKELKFTDKLYPHSKYILYLHLCVSIEIFPHGGFTRNPYGNENCSSNLIS